MGQGGGGLGAGGDIFVQSGATLSIGGSGLINAGSVQGGTGGATAGVGFGKAFADGIYLQGSNTLTFKPSGDPQHPLIVAGVIGDDTGSAAAAHYAGAPGYTEGKVGIAVDGTGTLVLTAAETYSGNTTIKAGTLELGSGGSIPGSITFTAAGATLQFDMPFDTRTHQSTQLGGAIVGAAAGDNIDLRFQPFATGDHLVWQQNGSIGTLSLETASNSVLASLKLSGSYTQSMFTAKSDGHNGTLIEVQPGGVGGPQPVSAATIESDTLAITRTALPQDQATNEANAINADTTTETAYVNGLLTQVADTTVTAVAVEGSMYNDAGTSAEITELVTSFLPAQIDNAMHIGLNPQIYASESLGLAFAFNDENGGHGFANTFGPSNAATPATPAGDAAFSAEAAVAIFGSAATANTVPAILEWVANWEAFYTAHGIPGVANATADQIDLAARGAAWGDAVGVALANHLGSLPGQVTNFLEDAAQGTAAYSSSLASQPTPAPFEGALLGAVNSANLLSLAGGGIKAMTADAGLFAGLLDYFSSKNDSTTISNLLSKVSAVSANSGSSWFTDLLAYSKSFDSSLQNYKSFFTSSTGYMQQLETAYNKYASLPDTGVNAIIQDLLNGVGSLAGVKLGDPYALLNNSSANWNNFLSNVIFEPDNSAQLLQSVNFHTGQRTGDLPTQSLIYELAISSNDAAINKYSSFLGTATNETVSTITNAGNDASGNPYVFIPAVITSLGSTNDNPAPALPSISADGLDVTYSTYSTLATKQSATTTLPNFDFDGLSAFLATSASSAAVSVVASGARVKTH